MSRHTITSIALCATSLLVLGSLPLRGQRAPAPSTSAERGGRASIAGTVRDEGAAPVAGAEVRLPLLDRGTVAGEDGSFRITGLPATSIVVTVRALGRQPWSATLALQGGREERVDVRLGPARVELLPVVVTGTATASDPTTPLDVAAIDPAVLRTVTTASLGRTLERVPGVASISSGPMAGNPVLRGMSQGQVRLTRDGVAMESFQGTSRWTPPISFGSVDRVEVIRGPASVLYGSSAMGGAVNFLPKLLPRSESGRATLGGLLESQYFSNNGERYGNGELSGAVGGFGFRGGINRRVAGDFRTAEAPDYGETGRRGDPLFTGVLPFTNYDQRAGYGQFGYADDWGQAQLLYDGFDGFNNFLNLNGRPAGVAMSNHELRARGTWLRGPLVIKPSLTRQLLRIRRAASAARSFEEARADDSWDQDLERAVTTARVDLEHASLAGLAGKVGVEVQGQRGETHLSRLVPSSRTTNLAAFLFEEYRVSRLTLATGVRYDHRTQRAQLGSLVSALPEAERDDALDRRFSVVNGSFGAGVRLSEAVTWTTSLSTGFRAPAVQDLYTDENRPAFGYLEGNPRLDPERSVSIETGMRVQGSRAAGSVTIYRNSIQDYISLQNTGRTRVVDGEPRIVYTNRQDDGMIRGIEGSGEGEIAPRLFLEGSVMALRSVNRATGESLPLMPADQLRGSLRWTPARAAFVASPTVRLGARHARAKRIAGATEPFAEFDTNPLGFGISSTPAYTVWEAGAGGRLALGARVLDIHVEVQNLLDTPYRDFLDTQKGFALAQGRNVSVRVTAPFTLVR